MSKSRRDFLKKASIGSAAIASGGLKLGAGDAGQIKTVSRAGMIPGRTRAKLNIGRGDDYTDHLQDQRARWLSAEPCNWQKARWISLPDNSTDPHTYFLARKTFELEEVPEKAVIHISADLYYRLWINGQFIDSGPPRDTQIIMAYRSFEISGLLTAGSNVVAIEVYQNRYFVFIHRHRGAGSYRGKNRIPAADRMALICQLDINGNSYPGTGKSWKILPGEAWASRAVRSSLFSQAEVYDARNEPGNWKLPDYDDSNWQVPGDDPAPEAFAKFPPEKRPHAKLEASYVPPVNRDFILPSGILAIGEVSDLGRVLSRDIGQKMGYEHIQTMRGGKVSDPEFLMRDGKEPVIIENGHVYYDRADYYRFLDERNGTPEIRDVTILIDFGEMMNGHFLLDLEPAEPPELDFMPGRQMFGSSAANVNYGLVDVAWTQELVDGQVEPRVYASDPGSEGSGFDLAHAGRYTMKKGRQVWESFHYQQFRYVQLTFRDLNGPLKLHRFGVIRTRVPLPQKGSFSCSDPVIDWTWKATARTLPLCMHDNCVDNQLRERGLYTGDCGVAYINSGLPVFGDGPFLKNFIKLFTAQLEDRRYLRYVVDVYQPVKEDTPDILFHPVQQAYALCEYFYHCTDDAFIRNRIYPLFNSLLEYVFGLLNENGVFEDPQGWQFLDWADLDNNNGEVAPQSLYLAMVLTEVSRISRFLGKDNDADKYTRNAGRIRNYIYDNFWNGDEELYVDSISGGKQNTTVFSEHTNCLALINGLGKNGRGDRIAGQLFRYKKNRVQSETGFMMFLLKALFRSGYEEKGLELMKQRYSRLYRRGYDTLPEEWSHRMSVRRSQWISRWRSMAQSAACGPAYVISTELLGINPTAPRFREMEIRPRVLLLPRASGSIPTPQGEVAVSWEKRQGSIYVSVDVPESSEADVVLPPQAKRVAGSGSEVPVRRPAAEPERPEERAIFRSGPGRHHFELTL